MVTTGRPRPAQTRSTHGPGDEITRHGKSWAGSIPPGWRIIRVRLFDIFQVYKFCELAHFLARIRYVPKRELGYLSEQSGSVALRKALSRAHRAPHDLGCGAPSPTLAFVFILIPRIGFQTRFLAPPDCPDQTDNFIYYEGAFSPGLAVTKEMNRLSNLPLRCSPARNAPPVLVSHLPFPLLQSAATAFATQRSRMTQYKVGSGHLIVAGFSGKSGRAGTD